MDATAFYLLKSRSLDDLRKALDLACDSLWELRRLEESHAAVPDSTEINEIFDKVTEAHQQTHALLDAVKAMLP